MHTINIRPRAPFDFARTASFLRFTEAEAVDTFDGNSYRRLFQFGERLHLIRVESQGTIARPSLVVSVETKADEATASQDLQRAAQFIERIFSIDHDLKKFRAAIADDPLMCEIEAAHHGLHLARWPTLFESLSISILLQQISTAVAVVLKRRLVEKYGARLRVKGETFFAFPRPEILAAVPIEELRTLGISGAKAAALIAVARETMSGAIDERKLEQADNETVIARLTGLRGVGRWTAEWALLLHFGRTNLFPAGDLALRKFVFKYYNNGAPLSEREVRAIAAERWGEWGSYVTIYVLAALRTGIINLRPDGVLLSSKTARV
ncbi:MAG: DNA-3-methyladenine glycosylase [Pyrinomonadaceae bacterium]